MRTIIEYFFIFMLYSVGGWIIETLLFIFRDKKVVKRGFLFGPLCPIYGCGAVLCTAILYGRINNIFLVFICGLLLCGTLEYITHFVMEKLFNAMWWDYSGRRFNIKGRVYLKGLIQFGLGVVLIIKVLQPFVYKLIDLIPSNVLYLICFVLYSFVIIDLTATILDLKNVISSIKYLQGLIITKSQNTLDFADEKISEQINKIEENEKVNEVIGWLKNDNPFYKRFKAKYPSFTLTKYAAAIEILRDKPIESKKRTDIIEYGTADTIPTGESKKG